MIPVDFHPGKEESVQEKISFPDGSELYTGRKMISVWLAYASEKSEE